MPSSFPNTTGIWWYESKTTIGTVHMGLGCGGVLKIRLPQKLHEHTPSPPHAQPAPTELASLSARVAHAIDQVLSCEPARATLPLVFQGTQFQVAVWQQIAQLKPDGPITYGAIARILGNPGAARAVGSACGANPFPLIIPCHRVVSSSGIGGFSGDLKIKELLLARERNYRKKEGWINDSPSEILPFEA